MKTHTKQELVALIRARLKKHVPDVAAIACGALMGAVFMTYTGTNDARSPANVTPVLTVENVPDTVTIEPSASPDVAETTPQASSASSSLMASSAAPRRPAIPKAIKIAIAPSSSPETMHPAAEESSVSASSSPQSSAASVSVSSSDASSPETVTQQSSSSSRESVGTSSSQASSSASVSSAPETSDFPAFDHASWPVGKAPNWGAMTTPAEWTRSFDKMTDADFVKIPAYDLSVLTTPMSSLTNPRNDVAITAKLFYSTRFFGAYDLDSGEFTGTHAGVDLKLPRGMPIGSIGGGRVTSVTFTQMLGLHVIIEHRLKNGETYYSIYGHLDRASVSAGQNVRPGTTIGVVGMTGNTTAPHLHLQIDRGESGEDHVPYFVTAIPSSAAAARHVVNPVQFLSMHRND